MPTQPDVDVFAEIMVAAIKAATDPLFARIVALESLQATKSSDVVPGPQGPQGPPGADADVDTVKTAVLTHIAPMVSEEAIEQVVERVVTRAMSAVAAPRDGVDGKDADVASVTRAVIDELAPVLAQDVSALVGDGITKAMAAVERPKDGADGKDADMDEIRALIATESAKAVASRPPPKDGQDGRSIGVADVEPVIEVAVTKALASWERPKDGQPGEPGRSVEPADVAPLLVPMVTAEVAKTLASWERPKDGASVTIDDVAPLIDSSVTKAISAIPTPKDGVGMAGALVDLDGQLVVTLTDGTVKQLGGVVGRDGRDVDMTEVTKQIADAVALLPRPKDGAPGRDGTLENLKVIKPDDRTYVLAFKDGTPLEGGTLRFNHPLFRDTYSDASKSEYVLGDMVQYDGSGWVAIKNAPPGRPGEGSPDVTGWRLWIKKGAAGKNGKDGTNGRDGKDGKDGKDRY